MIIGQAQPPHSPFKMSDPAALLAKFKLAPLPENVLRLGKLVQGFNKHSALIAEIILSDEHLSKRVTQIANRGKGTGTKEEVEAAVLRLGVDLINMVVMTELIVHALRKTFTTMLRTDLELRDEISVAGDRLWGTISFKGNANGRVVIGIPVGAADWIVSQFLGSAAPEDPMEIVQDVVGEMLNIVGGNLKSNLCDAGVDCTLSTPAVEIREFANLTVGDDEKRQTLYFHADRLLMSLDLLINPLVSRR
jgi:chemotaxis protein CheX